MSTLFLCVCGGGGGAGLRFIWDRHSVFQQNLSRGLLPSDPEGKRMANVLVARILEEVSTFCGENTISGCASFLGVLAIE